MEQNHKELLRRRIEEVMEMPMHHTKDFEILASSIEASTGQRVGISTLKRFWGYIDKHRDQDAMREGTLNILAHFVGSPNWTAFCNNGEEPESDDQITNSLYTRDLNQGQQIEIRWVPNRQLTIKYLGNEQFRVLASNCKLQVDDLFRCSYLLNQQPLLITEICRAGFPPMDYVCGKYHGISFTLL